MSAVCLHCKNATLKKVEDYCQEQVVCTTCGAVSAEGSLAHDPSDVSNNFCASGAGTAVYEENSTLPWTIAKEKHVTVAEGKKAGLKNIRYLTAFFAIPSHMRSAAFEMFGKAFHDPTFVHLSRGKKIALSTCIVYVVLRQNDWPMTISSLCEAAQCDMKLFAELLSKVSSFFRLSTKTTPLEELVPTFLKDANFPTEDIAKRILLILELLHKVWLSYGKKPDAIISSAAYLAWISFDISRRWNVSYKDFCHSTNLRMAPSAPSRLKEMLEMLQKLAAKLPWMEKSILSKREILCSLENVLTYKKSLLLSSSNEIDDETDEEPPYPFVGVKRQKLESSETPLVVSNLKVSNSPDLTEDDIPENQLHDYIRSAKEVNEIEKFLEQKKKN